MQFLEPFLRGGWNILLVVFGLGLIVFLHELGHFLLAKRNGVRVEAFALGFGPVLWKRQHGETEYRISLLPLGGYVKMAGESLVDDRRGEPWELTSKTPWQRFQIFVAGATMNLLIAFPLGVAAYVVGKVDPINVVGQPGYAEALAGIRPGDVVLQVGDRKIESLDKLLPEMIRRRNGTQVPVIVRRRENGVDVEKTFHVGVRQSPFHQTQAVSTMLKGLREGSALWSAGFRDGDLIASVDGQPVYDYVTLLEMVSARKGSEAVLEGRRWKADWSVEALPAATLRVPSREMWRIPLDSHLYEARVGSVSNGSGAWEHLEPDDLIVSVAGEPVRSWRDLLKVVEAQAVKEVDVRVQRKGKGLVDVKVMTGVKANGKASLGVAPGKSGVVAHVEPGSYAEKAGLKAGDVLVEHLPGMKKKGSPAWAADGIGGKDVPASQPAPEAVVVKIQRSGVPMDLKLEYMKVAEADLGGFGLQAGDALALTDAKLERERSFGDAFAAGMHEPVDVTVMTFDILRKLIMREESAKGLSGPIGIFAVTFKSAELAFGNYLWLLCLITVNLGVFNLLPIPVLDGGHNVLLLIEVVRKWFGKPPPSERFVAAFQYSGLLFILCLFVLVTYNDIDRLLRG